MNPEQNSFHWSYPHWGPASNLPQPRTSLSLKRSISESEDCDDDFSEESKDHCSSPGDADSCQMLSRKKRRGIIEKRRRDRINTSLTELRRLVPSAYEKQGSAKLEKAEILQMTVDHLKMVHAKGIDAFDPSKKNSYAMDYHNIGFRECAAEVARYLVTVEGLDIQDPLRLRLMSHLQCFAAQRELAAKQPSSWYPGNPPPGANAGNLYPPTPMSPVTHQLMSSSTVPHSHQSSLDSSGSSLANSSMNSSSMNNSSSFNNSASSSTPCESSPPSMIKDHPHSSSATSHTLTPLTTVTSAMNYHQSYHHQNPSMNPYHHHSLPTNPQSNYSHGQGPQMKPYRPWGAEVAY